jgi:transposase
MRRGQVQDLLLHVGGQSEQVHDLRQPGSADMPRPVEFDNEAYRRRNIVERLIGWLKESRRIFSRYEKTAKNFAGMLTLAFIRQYLRYELV